ncbi:MAG: hypothetical protein HY791_36275 [Deltaproteobacteria bacterium]|nr:hypothetical protein [Deltaproteobacteria bacterium]
MRLATDENLNNDIVRGLLRGRPESDVVRIQDVGLSGADDPTGDRVNAGVAATAFLETWMEKMPANPALEDPEPLRDEVKGLMRFAQSLKEQGADTSEVDGLIEDGTRGAPQGAAISPPTHRPTGLERRRPTRSHEVAADTTWP